ncbi:MAG: glycosyltransferase family 39 protein [Flavobacteriales bacterium]
MQLLVAIAVLALVASVGLFDDFADPHVNMWDEATYALNAFDQAYNGFSLNLTSEGKTDYYNTKPPLAIWIEAMSIRLFGFNTFAIRIHSILFAFLTAFLTWFTCLKISNRNHVAILSGVILLLSQGFIHTHVARTGDLDSTLVFFETIYVAATLLFAMEKISWPRFSLVFIVGAVGAFFSKGIAGFFMMPSVIITMIVLRSGQLKSAKFYFPIATSVILCGGYYLLKWINDPEYWNVAYQTEIARYWDNDVIYWIEKPFSFYFNWIGAEGFYPFSYLLIIGMLPLILLKQLKGLMQVLYLIPFVFLLIISVPQAKMHWYDAAAYPWLAILAAVCLHLGFETLKVMVPKHKISLLAMFSIMAILLLYKGFMNVKSANRFQSETITDLETEGQSLMQIAQSGHLPEKLSIYKPTIHEEFLDQLKVSALIVKENHEFVFSIDSAVGQNSTFPLLISELNFTDSVKQLLAPAKSEKFGNCVLLTQES